MTMILGDTETSAPQPISSSNPLKVLYSFPHKIGTQRIALTAWQQVSGVAESGALVQLQTGVLSKGFKSNRIQVRQTLALGKFRLPYKVLGTLRTCAMHDWIVAQTLQRLANQIQVVHLWPLAALQTSKMARKLGIPVLLERPNAHTEFAYTVVREECEKLGIMMPKGHEHAYNRKVLQREKEEYAAADYLLCPSDFVAKTFLDKNFPASKLLRHQYGFDETQFSPRKERPKDQPFTMLFAGGCAPRKGLHFALDAWLSSTASKSGEFWIVGSFIPEYEKILAPKLGHPSIKVLGFRTDLHKIMREADVFVLPSIEEGSALVTSEARGSGCVLLVSDAAGAICKNGENALVHRSGDVKMLSRQIESLNNNPELLATLRHKSLETVHSCSWRVAGNRLLDLYRQTCKEKFR